MYNKIKGAKQINQPDHMRQYKRIQIKKDGFDILFEFEFLNHEWHLREVYIEKSVLNQKIIACPGFDKQGFLYELYINDKYRW